jgi:uncharacterized membrane protein
MQSETIPHNNEAESPRRTTRLAHERRDAHTSAPRATMPQAHTNVGQTERIVSALVGSACLLTAVRRPSPASAALALGAGALLHRGVTGHCYVNQALGRNSASGSRQRQSSQTARSLTIERPVADVYRAWRDPKHMSAIMSHFAAVTAQPDGRWHWRIQAPMGRTYEWTSTAVQDIPNELIAWRTDANAPIPHEGSVRFSPAPRDWGTVVTLSLGFGPDGGPLAALVSKLLPSVPHALEASILRRSKELCVAGEIPTLRRNPSARSPSARRRSDAGERKVSHPRT